MSDCPMWSRWGISVRGWRVYGMHRGWGNGTIWPAALMQKPPGPRALMPMWSMYLPFTPWGVGWRRNTSTERNK